MLNRRTSLLAVFIALAVIGGAMGAGVLIYHATSQTSMVNSEAPTSVTTTITGVSTNAQNTPIELGGNSYTSATITGFTQTDVSSSPFSSVSFDGADFVPGTYVYFEITVTNTGTTALYISTYTVESYYLNLKADWGTPANTTLKAGNGGGLLSTPQLVDQTDYPGLNDYFLINNTFATTPAGNGTSSDIYSENPSFGMDTFSESQNYFGESAYNTQWFSDNAVPTEVNPTIAPGSSFTWYWFVGLGSNAPLNLPAISMSLSITLVPAA